MMHVRINRTLVLHELILGIANPNVKTIAPILIIKAISEESRTQATRMPSAWVKSSISPQLCEVSFHQKAGYYITHFLTRYFDLMGIVLSLRQDVCTLNNRSDDDIASLNGIRE